MKKNSFIKMVRDMTRADLDKQTLSDAQAFVNDIPEIDFKVIELPWLNNQRRISCIPAGKYPCIKHISPSFGNSFWLQDVPDRSEILMHLGNYAGSKNPRTGRPDTLGCLLPGEKFADIDGDGLLDVTSSKRMMNRLYSTMPNEFDIIIEEKREPVHHFNKTEKRV